METWQEVPPLQRAGSSLPPEDGWITARSLAVDMIRAIRVIDNADGNAGYKGLASNNSGRLKQHRPERIDVAALLIDTRSLHDPLIKCGTFGVCHIRRIA
ncbi:hypothetical protein [Noviherbaspirillum malthae]|uniref:hypothetical protein n=1 Tax=Noviherbaspirillum malthae TaxID=1260987 RepID=UPI00188FB234|nr:hypothetical protein [Noviherbaspirillum malthae]